MRTTTVVFQFAPEASQEILDKAVATWHTNLSPFLSQFCESRNISSDNLVSEVVVHETCLRTVVRSWPDLATATAWINTVSTADTGMGDSYPGKVISAAVDPE